MAADPKVKVGRVNVEVAHRASAAGRGEMRYVVRPYPTDERYVVLQVYNFAWCLDTNVEVAAVTALRESPVPHDPMRWSFALELTAVRP